MTTGPCARRQRERGSQWGGASSVRPRSREGGSPLASTHTDVACRRSRDPHGLVRRQRVQGR